jgi:hypothetical protein
MVRNPVWVAVNEYSHLIMTGTAASSQQKNGSTGSMVVLL